MCRQITVIIIIFQFIVNCKSPKSEENSNKESKKEKMMPQETDIKTISKWLDLRDVKLENFVSEDVTKAENVAYEGLQNVTRVHLNEDTSKYYFFNAAENCVMIYVNDMDTLETLSTEEIIEIYGSPEETLRSRAGKTANHYVYAQKGFAFSVLDGTIIFFEVFPDSNVKQYKEDIYIEPLPFVL